MPPRHPRRLPSFDYIGFHRYFLTLCTESRRRYFTEAVIVEAVLRQMRTCAADQGFGILAYCFMPDHLHLLVEGQREDADGRRFITLLRQRSGFACRPYCANKLWQRFLYERVLRGEEATIPVARYILENPVRGKLVARAEDYAWSGSDMYGIREILDAAGAWSPPTSR
ncbi:MAG: transposase [Acidobacteria bacterium]|nr:transposase [Acidobacteriota bacterium]